MNCAIALLIYGRVRCLFTGIARYNILQKALFVDIKVLVDMIDSNLLQSNEEIEAFSRQT